MQQYRVHTKNDVYQLLETLKTNRQKRFRAGAFFVEGVRGINGALRYGWTVRGLVHAADAALSGWALDVLAKSPDADRYVLDPPLMAELSGRETPSELIALVEMRDDDPARLTLGDAPLIVVFDRPSNKGNLGSIIRSCDALGVDALLLTGHAVDLYDPEVVLATVGSLFALPVLRLEGAALDAALDGLRARYPGLLVVGTTSHRATPLYSLDLTGPRVVMIGNEQTGLSAKYREAVDLTATIPMAETSFASSFNAACAATVVLYEAAKQRGTGLHPTEGDDLRC